MKPLNSKRNDNIQIIKTNISQTVTTKQYTCSLLQTTTLLYYQKKQRQSNQQFLKLTLLYRVYKNHI